MCGVGPSYEWARGRGRQEAGDTLLLWPELSWQYSGGGEQKTVTFEVSCHEGWQHGQQRH